MKQARWSKDNSLAAALCGSFKVCAIHQVVRQQIELRNNIFRLSWHAAVAMKDHPHILMR